MLMNFVVHLLDGEVHPPEKVQKARESLIDLEKNNTRDVRKQQRRGFFEVREPDVLIRELADAIDRITPRGKISTVQKAVLRTIYTVGLVTVFVTGVAVSALYGLPGIPKVRVPAEFVFADLLNNLQTAVIDGGERRLVLTEVDGVCKSAVVLREVIDGGVTVEKGERLKSAVKEMKTATDVLSCGLDGLADGVNEMFRNVLSTRNGVLENYRVGPVEKQRK